MKALAMTAARFFTRVALLLAALSATAQESGGTTGADFLVSPPAARSESMGGALDPLGTSLDGLVYNPAALAGIEDFRVQLSINPLPNDVIHATLAAGFPLFGGVSGVAAQLLSTGGFTFVNESGQAQGTVNVYDAAATLSYARYLWSTIALGASIKAIYRTLGEYSAVAVAGDIGASTRFETPHIGQRPKPPTREQFASELARRTAGIDTEKERRVREAKKKGEDLNTRVAEAEKVLSDIAVQIEKAEEEKKEPLLARKAEAETKLQALHVELADAETAEQATLLDIDSWHAGELEKARSDFDAKVENLVWIETERKRLFEVIDDPAKDLTDEMIDENINGSIAKTESLLGERIDSFTARKAAYEQRRMAGIDELSVAITGYEAQIQEEVGSRQKALSEEIETLKSEKTTLESAEDKDAKKKEIQDLGTRIAAKEKEMQSLLADSWIKRLQERISLKKKEIEQLTADIAAMATATEKAVADARERAGRDIKAFEDLRVQLERELKKAKLKRELDGLEGGSQAALDKSRADYKDKEKRLYLRLLDAMYGHEEKIFQTRLASVREDSDIRVFDFNVEQKKTRESRDDEHAFQARQLWAKISQLTKDLPKGTDEPTEVVALREELGRLDQDYKQAGDEQVRKEKEFAATEKARTDAATTEILAEQTRVRLVYLQTDTPYLNTAIHVGVRNVGTPIQFVSTGAPLPATASVGLSYAALNVEGHNLKLTAQLDWPFYESWSVGIGLEYELFSLAYLRAGYTINTLSSGLESLSAGFGVRLAAGFTEYAVDYAFKPLPDYGFQHSIGVSISF